MTKYEFTGETKIVSGRTINQIRALKDVRPGVSVGDLGGWLESEETLSQLGTAWVSGTACVFGNARVFGNALVSGDALVSGTAWVSGDALVFGDARVCEGKVYA